MTVLGRLSIGTSTHASVVTAFDVPMSMLMVAAAVVVSAIEAPSGVDRILGVVGVVVSVV